MAGSAKVNFIFVHLGHARTVAVDLVARPGTSRSARRRPRRPGRWHRRFLRHPADRTARPPGIPRTARGGPHRRRGPLPRDRPLPRLRRTPRRGAGHRDRRGHRPALPHRPHGAGGRRPGPRHRPVRGTAAHRVHLHPQHRRRRTRPPRPPGPGPAARRPGTALRRRGPGRAGDPAHRHGVPPRRGRRRHRRGRTPRRPVRPDRNRRHRAQRGRHRPWSAPQQRRPGRRSVVDRAAHDPAG